MNIDKYKENIKVLGVKESFNRCVNTSKEKNNEINAFVTILDDYDRYNENGLLSGISYALKDNFSTKGILTTGSSNILKDYVPVFDSTVYKKLKDEGALLLGKTVLDELAMGGTGTTGHTGIVKNPLDSTRLIGGSSAGSAAAVAMGIVPFAIGSDTGDSVRKPASFAGVVGFKPTYGRISRFGLFPFASSLDHVGVITTNVKDAALVTDVIKGYDENDMTTLPNDNISYLDDIDNDIKGKKFCYIKEVLDEDENKEIFNSTLEKIKKLGITVEEESINKKLLSSIYASYYAISCAESTSNNANLTGIIYGPRSEGNTPDEILFGARTRGFSELIKRRFIIGSYVLKRENQEKLFLNAYRIRRLIVNEVNKLFKTYDAIILPTTAGIAPKIETTDEVLTDKSKIIDNHLIIGNFGGYPSITIPNGMKENMPLGISIMCNIYEDSLTLNLAHKIFEELRGEE